MGVDIFFEQDSWVEPIVELEQGMAGTDIFDIVLSKLSY